jgi:hypothetical protein
MQQSLQYFLTTSTPGQAGAFSTKVEPAPLATNAVEHLAWFALVAQALLPMRSLYSAPGIAHSQERLCYSYRRISTGRMREAARAGINVAPTLIASAAAAIHTASRALAWNGTNGTE